MEFQPGDIIRYVGVGSNVCEDYRWVTRSRPHLFIIYLVENGARVECPASVKEDYELVTSIFRGEICSK